MSSDSYPVVPEEGQIRVPRPNMADSLMGKPKSSMLSTSTIIDGIAILGILVIAICLFANAFDTHGGNLAGGIILLVCLAVHLFVKYRVQRE